MRTANQFFASTMGGESVPFITVWKTDNTSAGSSASNQVKLPLFSTGIYNFSVDWGDSSSDIITSWNQAETTHTYASPGTYTIQITRTCRGFRFANGGDRLKILDIEQWGGFINLVSNDPNTGSFQGCANLDITAADTPNFQAGPHQGFLRGCSSLVGTSAFADWNLSGVTNLARFFDGCTLFDQPINTWNVSNVTNVDSLFLSCTAFNQSLSSWNVGNVTIFNQMFRSASAFNQNIGSWDMSSANSLIGMFNLATAFNNGGSATINDWDVSNVTSFGTTNNGCFQSATAFDQPLGNWDVSSGTSLVDFMRNKTNLNYSATNLDAIYNGWSALPGLTPSLTVNFGTIKYTAASIAGKAILTSAPNNWTITDGGI